MNKTYVVTTRRYYMRQDEHEIRSMSKTELATMLRQDKKTQEAWQRQTLSSIVIHKDSPGPDSIQHSNPPAFSSHRVISPEFVNEHILKWVVLELRTMSELSLLIHSLSQSLLCFLNVLVATLLAHIEVNQVEWLADSICLQTVAWACAFIGTCGG